MKKTLTKIFFAMAIMTTVSGALFLTLRGEKEEYKRGYFVEAGEVYSDSIYKYAK